MSSQPAAAIAFAGIQAAEMASRGRVRTYHALDRAAIVASSQHPDIGGRAAHMKGLSWRVPTRRRPKRHSPELRVISASTRKEWK